LENEGGRGSIGRRYHRVSWKIQGTPKKTASHDPPRALHGSSDTPRHKKRGHKGGSRAVTGTPS